MKTFIALALLSLFAGCGRPFDVRTPRRFVELEEEHSGYDYRATSADGVVLGVRAIDIDPDKGEADVAFWAEAVGQRMRRIGGYALLEQVDVRGAGGRAGKQLRFGRDEGERPYRYWVTLFVDDDYLVLIEAGGAQEQFTRAERDVDRLIQSLRP
ncbi:MAG: serine/threonine protein kinase [Deltaproteobacteria bacterium]|nr:serine/threonine protein kinase [Deltaproteobacteria bacterium]